MKRSTCAKYIGFIADSIFLSDRFDDMVARVAARKMAPTGKQGRGGGGGPTGLTAAFYLALFGHEVTVYESHAEAGRHAALCAARIPPAEACPGQGN